MIFNQANRFVNSHRCKHSCCRHGLDKPPRRPMKSDPVPKEAKQLRLSPSDMSKLQPLKNVGTRRPITADIEEIDLSFENEASAINKSLYPRRKDATIPHPIVDRSSAASMSSKDQLWDPLSSQIDEAHAFPGSSLDMHSAEQGHPPTDYDIGWMEDFPSPTALMMDSTGEGSAERPEEAGHGHAMNYQGFAELDSANTAILPEQHGCPDVYDSNDLDEDSLDPLNNVLAKDSFDSKVSSPGFAHVQDKQPEPAYDNIGTTSVMRESSNLTWDTNSGNHSLPIVPSNGRSRKRSNSAIQDLPMPKRGRVECMADSSVLSLPNSGEQALGRDSQEWHGMVKGLNEVDLNLLAEFEGIVDFYE